MHRSIQRKPSASTRAPAAAIVRVPFRDGIDCIQHEGDVWVVVRRICDVLGVDNSGQRQRLTDADRSPWATAGMVPSVGADGRKRDVFCVRLDSLPMWLATLDTRRVKDPVARERVVAYQKESHDALRDYWFGGAAFNPRNVDPIADAEARVRALTKTVEELQAAAERGPLRGHRDFQRECWRLIKEVAKHEGVGPQKAHGLLRSSYDVPGYKSLTVRQYVKTVRGWLVGRLQVPTATVTALLPADTRQILFPFVTLGATARGVA